MAKFNYSYSNKAGRPTKFKARYVKDLIDFFNRPLERKLVTGVTKEFYKDGTEKKIAETFKIVPSLLPTLLAFAREIDVDYTTVYRWAEKQKEGDYLEKLASRNGVSAKDVELGKALREFRNAYADAKRLQKEFLINSGLSGAAPSSAFVFTAKNLTDMRDKVESEVRVTEVKPLLDNLRKSNGVSNNDRDREGSESN